MGPIVTEELELLARVSALLEDLPEPSTASEEPIIRELERLRDQLVGGRESKDMMALQEQWHRQSSLLRQLRRAGGGAPVDPASPYFAHLRLREGTGERDLCLGRSTCIEKGVRIVDWRNAPVSRVFYRYEQGDEYEEEFAGRVRTGVVVARRTLSIRGGRLERVEAPEGVFALDPASLGGWQRLAPERPRLGGGEASALRAFESGEGGHRRLEAGPGGPDPRADKHLPQITSLIDPAQFELITRSSSGFLLIRGTAGSGKTTVALHRIAYLAYDDPDVDSERTLFVAFSPALRAYVGHVLPALGVDRVSVVTYPGWASFQRRRHFPDIRAQTRYDTPASIQRLKLHPALGVALAEQVRRVPAPSTGEQALDDWASVLTQRKLLEEVCAREAPGRFSAGEIGAFVDWNRRQNEDVFARMAGEASVHAELDPEDDTLLLRAWQLRVGTLRGHARQPLRYRHVAIDEVQEFSPLEVQVLLDCLDSRRSLTLAGDTYQHVAENTGFTSWSGFLQQLGVPGSEVETLRVAYRSSHEIVRFALAVLGDLREGDEVPTTVRSGPPVESFAFTDRGGCVAFLADALRHLAGLEPLASVAVLTPSPELSALYYRGLEQSDLPSLHWVDQQNFRFAPGVEVTEIEQARGLEFDYVILVDASAEHFPDTAAARRLLHLGATRAVHQLWLTHLGAPSPLLPRA